MNIGDYVYVYLFDLEKSLINMKQLREDRFGKIININKLETRSNEFINNYSIQLLDNKVIEYRTDNLTTNIVSIGELMEIISKTEINEEKKTELLEQIRRLLFV